MSRLSRSPAWTAVGSGLGWRPPGRTRFARLRWLPSSPSLLLLLVLFLLSNACDGPAAPVKVEEADSVLLITVDTMRADALGARPDHRSATPNLDRLAAAGRSFDRAHAHSVMTLPSHANLLTGQLPYTHGVRDNGGFALDPGVSTLASRLAGAGFATAAFVAAYPLDSRFGLNAGFDVYDDDLGDSRGGGGFGYAERSGSEVVASALEWWNGAAGSRRFLWVHLFEPHAPYQPPDPFGGRFPDRPYLGEVAAADDYLGPLLERLRDEEARTLIVFTSDHGEGLGDHGERTHGLFAYESTLRVPLILAGPGVTQGRDLRWARHVDVVPSVLDAVGLEVPAGLPGRSLLVVEAETGPIYFEALTTHFNNGWAPLRGVVEDGRKLIELPLPELYDLAADPRESTNLFAGGREEARRLASRLGAEPVWPPRAVALAPDEVAPLRSLGYLASRAAAKETYTAADDPKNLVDLDRMINEVVRLYAGGELRRAVAVASDLIARRPEMPLPYSYLTTILLERGDYTGALNVMRRAQRHDAAQPDLLRQLGITLVTIGQPREAIELLEPLARGGREPTAATYLALAQASLGQTDEALTRLRKIADDFPDNASAPNGLAYLAVGQGRFADARDAARRALDVDPGLASAWNNLAVAEHGLDRPDQAIEAWRRGLELDPADLDTLYNLGVVASESGRVELAREVLERFVAAADQSAYSPEIEHAKGLLATLGG